MTRAPAPPHAWARWFDAGLLDQNPLAVDLQSIAGPVLEQGRAFRVSGWGLAVRAVGVSLL